MTVDDIPDAQPGSNELENKVRGKQAASKASVKSLPERWFPASCRNILKAESCSSISVGELWLTLSLALWHLEWKPIHLRAHSVNF